MQNLIKTIIILRQRIETYRADLSKNETMTRYALIDPLLVELDWNLSDPGDVVPEDKTGTGSKTDYTMGRNAMIVEAKKLDENLDKYTEKLTKYVQDKSVRYGVLTNGQKWRMYDSETTMKSPQMEFDITDSEGVVISKAIQLHRSVVLDGVLRQPRARVKTVAKRMNVASLVISDRRGDEKILSDIMYVKDMAHPKELVCPDKRVPLNSWIDLLAGVANWLVSRKHLDKSHCPIPIGTKNAILNTRPVHQNGKSFSTQKEVGNLYLNTNTGPSNAIRYAIRLIEAAGIKISYFKAYFEDPNHPDPWPKTDDNA